MSNNFYNYDTAFIPGQLARAEAVANEFISVQTGFGLLVTQGADSGIAANAYVVTTPGQPTVVYADGNTVEFKPNFTNTGVSTINVNAIGAVPILRFNGSALIAGDLTANVWTTVVYNSTFNAFTVIGAGQTAVIPGSISLAAPTNKVGLVAAGGASISAAPIDATFAIDQGMAPTWTGVHTFSAKPVMNAGLTVTGAAITSSAGLTVSAGTTAVQALTATTGVFNSTLSAAGVTSSAGLTVSAGGATIATASGVSLTVTGAANIDSALITSPNTASQSFGLEIRAGTNSSDYALSVTNAAASLLLKVFGDGGLVAGAATGGDKGLGTVNATGLFINGVAVTAGAGAGGVSSITGTANQIAASASTGAVTLSLPQNVIIPTPASGTALAANFATPSVASDRGALFLGSGAGDARIGVSTTTAGNAQLNLDTQGVQNWVLGNARGDGSFRISSAQALGTNDRFVISAAGNVSIPLPGSGIALVLPSTAATNSLSAANAFLGIGGAFLAGQTELFTASTNPLGIGTSGAAALHFYTNSILAGTVSSSGNWTIAAPSSGNTITASGAAIQFASKTTVARGSGSNWIDFQDPTGESAFVGFGNANSNFSIQNLLAGALTLGTNNAVNATISSAGGLFMAGATGGDQGAGTINATGLFVNGAVVALGRIVVKQASTTSRSTVTLSNDAVYTAAIPSAGTYQFRLDSGLFNNAIAGSQGITYNMNFSGTFTTGVFAGYGCFEGGVLGASGSIISSSVAGSTPNVTTAVLTPSTGDAGGVMGTLIATAAGTLALSWAGTTGAASMSIGDGSLVVERIA